MMLKRIVKFQNGGYYWDPNQINMYGSEVTSEEPLQNLEPDTSLDNLANFTMGFETYQSKPYKVKGQTLAGYGSADPKIISLARQGKLTEEIARNKVMEDLRSVESTLSNKLSKYWGNLSRNVQLALIETGYNIGVNKLLTESPKLMTMIKNGIVDPKELIKEMDHSKTAGGWLGVRSSARRAMALGEYDWDYPNVDVYGRQVDPEKPIVEEDWTTSPYYNKYKQGGFLKRIK